MYIWQLKHYLLPILVSTVYLQVSVKWIWVDLLGLMFKGWIYVNTTELDPIVLGNHYIEIVKNNI